MFDVQVLNNPQEEVQAERRVKQVSADTVLCGQHRQVEQVQAELILHEFAELSPIYIRYSRLKRGSFNCRNSPSMLIIRAIIVASLRPRRLPNRK
jgi:hypothetical protein